MNPDMAASLATWGPILIMVAIFYFLLYRPQKNEQKRRKELLDNLTPGDKVVTIGGIYGEITAVRKTVVRLKISPKTEIEVARSAINVKAESEDDEDDED
ncbi:MAG: preprotein translocase subunit YajC [Selenomonadaceae bacterium]|nr:preprotein translocase subunit YajC [Selenomonadaceae bacterium]